MLTDRTVTQCINYEQSTSLVAVTRIQTIHQPISSMATATHDLTLREVVSMVSRHMAQLEAKPPLLLTLEGPQHMLRAACKLH